MRLTIRKTLKRSWLAALAVVGIGSTALAAPIEINNASFEAPGLPLAGGETWTNDLSGWVNPNAAGDVFTELIGGFAAEGPQHVGTQNGAFIYQKTGVAAEPNTTYTLIVGLGFREGQSQEGGTAVLGLAVLDGDAELTEATANAQVAADDVLTATSVTLLPTATAGNFEDGTLSFTTAAEVPPGVITILLGDDDSPGRSHFDNVRLYSQPGGTNIGPESEFQTAAPANNAIVLDGDLSEWNANPIVDARNRVGGDGAGELVPFEPFGGGTWDGPEDHSNVTYLTYDADNVYVGVIVTDDYHEHAAEGPGGAWNGDAIQLHVTGAARDTAGVLRNFALQGVEGALGDVVIHFESPTEPDGSEAVITRAGTTTTYEIKLPKEVVGLDALEPGVQLGIGMTINDGDEAEPGQKGWGGLGTHSIVYGGKTPSETALVTLGAPFEQIWTVGMPGDGWPQDLGTGGGPETVFVQEAGVNELPGEPNNSIEARMNDDDYYFAGVYDTILDGGTYTPLGTVEANEVGAERAFAGDDNSIRYHFNFPSSIGPGTHLAVSWDAENLHAGEPDPRYGVEVYVNGRLVAGETLIRDAQLGLINTTPAFTLGDVNGMVGAGFDNYVEIRGINYNADGGGNWMGVDHVSLAAAPQEGGGGVGGPLLLDFAAGGDNSNGTADGWVGVDNLVQDVPLSVGGGVTLTALEDGFNPNNPAGPGADGVIDGRTVPQNVLDDYLFKITDAADTSAVIRIDGLAAGDWDITVFEGRTTDAGQFGKIWVGEEPADQNTGDFAAGKWGTVTVTVADGDAVNYRHLEDNSGGISGMIIAPAIPRFIAGGPGDAGPAGLNGQYWSLEPKAVITSGNPFHRPGGPGENAGWVDANVYNTPHSGTFVSTDPNYVGNDLTPITEWLGADGASYSGDASDTAILGDGVLRLTGYLWVAEPGDRTFSINSDDGSTLYINNELVVQHDNGHGQNGDDPLPPEQLATVNFPEAGYYPVDLRYFNGDWTNDAGDHGGANLATTGLDSIVQSVGAGGGGLNIAFVSFHDTDAASDDAAAADPPITDASDIGYTNLLTANGHTVTRVLTSGDRSDADALNAFDLIIISRSVSSGHYSDGPNSAFWNTAITTPVINLGGYTFRSSRLNWTDGTTMVDTDGPVSLSVAVADHPIFAGVDLSGPYAEFIEGERGVSFNMNTVVGGTVLATAADTATAGGAAIFEFAAGAEANNGNAIAGPKLAFLTGSRELDRTSQTSGFYDLTASGEAMFLNAVNYMGAGAGFEFAAPNAAIVWSDVNPDTGAGDLIGGSSITFTPGTYTGSNADAAFFTGDGGDSGNAELNEVYNSHGWNATPGATLTLDGLTTGTEYQVQLLGAGDTRGCCNTRTQTADDGNGNVSGEFLRGNSSVVGTFTATGPTQDILIGGANDPGLSGYIVAVGGEAVMAVNNGRTEGADVTVNTAGGGGPIEEYAGSFDFADGTTDLGDGSVIGSNNDAAPASVQGGKLRLTTAESGGGGASFTLPGGFDGSGGWTMTFDLEIEHTGGNTPADGMSINYGDLSQVTDDNRFGSPAEEGYGTSLPHVSYQVDTWKWDVDTPDDRTNGGDAGVAIGVTGVESAFNRAVLEDANVQPNERVTAKATLTWDPEKGASFVTVGFRTNADFINVPTPDFNPDASYGFSFLARTGGHNETVEIDNIVLVKGAQNLGGADPIADGLLKLHYEFEEGEGVVVNNLATAGGGGGGVTMGAVTDASELDFSGDIIYAVAARSPGGAVIGDATFTTSDETPGLTYVAQNEILDWATPINLGDGADNDALEGVLNSIRWSNAADDPTGVTYDFDVAPGNYQITLLFGEKCCDRGFDVSVNGELVADNFSPNAEQLAGGGLEVTGGFLTYTGSVSGSTLSINLDGTNTEFPDKNAIISGIVIEALGDGGAGGVVADSIADWAGTDEQGVNGWTYGYRGLEFGGPVDYDPADFTAFSTDDGWIWGDAGWDWSNTVPWTAVGQEEGHPNTTDRPDENTTGTILHHAVRRWTSDVEGDVLISYSGREVNLNGGGVVVGVHINGVLLESTQIAGGDAEGFTSTVAATLAVGDVVDCFLSPTDVDGTEADGSDGSAWSMVIETVGEGAPDGLVTTTNNAIWQSSEDTLSVGGPGYMFFDSANGDDMTYIDTGMTPADLGIEDAPYTMMVRVRQDEIGVGDSGDAMIFGQAGGEVLHNGARGDQLYVGHWGDDHGGGSVALGEWRHIAYVYDGADQIIYIDGTEVSRSTTGDKKGLGTGNKSKDTILIGTTRLDQDRDFIGCLDDVRIYCAQLTEAQIRAIACASPRADCDGDGIADSVELAVFGTLDRDGTGDFDGDRLNDATEFALGTAMDNRDTDGDGAWDSQEVWGFYTDPLSADSDGDGLSDQDEIAAGTDPTSDDTDRDGITDGDELANGPTTTEFDFSTDPGLELLNFSDGATPPEVRAEGGNPGGYLSLTDAENGARATIIFPDTTGGQNIAGFKFGVDARIGGGTERPADGLSVSLVRGDDPVLADPIGSTFAGTTDLGGTEESLPEEGTRTGVSVGFDAWESGGEDIVGFSVRVDGALIEQIAAGTLNGELDDPTSLQTGPLGPDGVGDGSALGWARFEICLEVDGTLDVTWKGSKLVEDVQTNWTASPGQLVFAARTGGANQAHHFDNLSLVTIPEGAADPLVFNEGAVEAGLLVHYEFDDFESGPVLYSENFDALEGASDLGDGSILFNEQAPIVVTDGALPLTLDDVNSQNANWKLPPMDGLSGGFWIEFDVALFDAEGDNPPADGFSFNLGNIADDALAGEEGFGAGLAVEFDTWDNGGEGAASGIGIDISVDGADLATNRIEADEDKNNNQFFNFDGVFRRVSIHFANGLLDVHYGDLVIASGLDAGGWAPVDGDRIAFGARTGGANESVIFDNMVVSGASDGRTVTNLGNGPAGTLVAPEGVTLRDLASTDLSTPTEVWTTAGSIPTMNNTNDGADLLDATWQAWIDFNAKPDGGAENIFESGAGTIGVSFVYEAPSTLVMRSTGLGGNALAVASAELSQADVDAGELHVIWTHDSNPDGPETLAIWINGELRGSGSLEKGNDWSGGDGGNVLVASTNLAGSGSNSSLPGNAGDFVSGTANLDQGIQFFRDTLFQNGIIQFPGATGDDAVYVDTNLTAPQAGASGENYTMMARVSPNDLAGDNMVFGQVGGNVLHNGFRDAQFYQGHWGNDLGGGTAAVGQTYDVAWRYTAQQQTIYVDGEPVAAGPGRGALAELGNVLVGTTRLDQDRGFNGAVDSARIYNRALSSDLIRDIQGGNAAISSKLIVRYEFEDGISMTVRNQGNSGAPDGHLNSLDVIGAYTGGSPSTGGPGALNLDSTNGADATYVDTGLTPAAAGIMLKPYTMTAWVRQTALGDGDNNDAMVFGQVGGDVLHNGARGEQPYFGHWGDDVGGGTINLDQWTHYAWTSSGDNAPGTIAIYQNGELIASDTKNGLGKSPDNILIGTTRLDQNRDFVGQLDDIRIYCGVLTPAEIVEVGGLVDSDGDGLLDPFERAFFGNLAMGADGDTDMDGISNLDEQRLGLDPTVNDARFADADGDGWSLGDETEFETNPDSANSFPSFFVGGGQWEVRTVQAAGTITGLAEALMLLNGEIEASADDTTFHDFINFGAGAQGSVGGDEPFPGGAADNFATHAKAEIEVTHTGDYIVSYSTDDGMQIIIDGNVVGEFAGGRGAPGIDPYPVRLTAGRHMVELIQFEQGGGDAAEFAGTIASDNSLTGLGGNTVVLIPAAAPDVEGPAITSINFMGQQGADGAPGTPLGGNEITGVVAAGNWNNLGPAIMNAVPVVPTSVSIDFESDVEGLEFVNNGDGAPEVRAEGGNPGGYLSLTDAINSANASIIFPDLSGGLDIAGFTFGVDARIGGGTDRPADGMSVNLVRPDDPLLADDSRGVGYADGVPEEGSTTGIGIGFDAWDSGNGDVVGFSVRVEGELVEQVAAGTLNGALDDVTSLQTGDRGPDGAGDISALGWARFEVALSPTGELDVAWKGNSVISGLQTGWTPSAGQLVFGARTGGANQAHHFDNLELSVIPAGAVIDNGGSANGLEVTWAANTMWTTFAPGDAGDPTAKMMDGYLDDTDDQLDGSDYSFVNLGGIPYSQYDIVAYFTSDGNDRSGAARVNGGDDTYLLTAGNNNPVEFIQATAAAEGDAAAATYVWWQGLSGPEALVEWRRISNNVGLAGIQIIDTGGGGAPSPLAAGLIGYWPFEGDFEDKIGDAHGFEVGTAPIEFADGAFGQGIDLDGVDQYVSTPVETEDRFDFTEGNFSVSAWFRVDGFDKNWQALVTKGEGSNWRIHRRGDTDHLGPVAGPRVDDATRGADMVDGPDVNDGAIHHVIITNGPDGSNYYLDGVLAGEAPAGGTQGNEWPMMIGENADGGGNGRTWNGVIDDVAVWNRQLSEEEVGLIVNGPSIGDQLAAGGGGGVAGLLGYWPEEYASTADNHLDLGTIPAQTLDSQFSWSFWVNAGEGNGPNNTIFGNRWMADGVDFDPREFIKFTPTKFEWHFNGGGENVGNDDTVLPVGEWVHNLVVKDGANITYFRNGAEVASGVVTGTPVNAQPLFLGGAPNTDGNTAEGFIGDLKEVATFGRALSAADVTDVYNRGLNGESLAGGGADPRAGAVAKSSGPLSGPTLVDFGALDGDASFEFAFNAVKAGASTALAGNTAWALKLDQWNETGFIGTTEFGVADHTSTVPAVFGADTHVVFVSDTAAGETHIYVNGELGGSLPGNPALAGEVTVMGATRDPDPIDVFGAGSSLHGWATYNSALSAGEVAALAGAPFGGGGPSGPMPIAHWTLDEITADGTSPDSAGSRDLTANNLTADDVVEGKIGNAIAFDAARETLLHYTAEAGQATATSNPAYTVALWTKTNGTGQNDLRLFSEASTTSGTPLFNLGTANNGADGSLDLYMRTQDNGNPYNHPHTTALPLDDAWHHIAFTQEAGGQIAVYVDGVADAIDTATLLPEFGGGINTTSIGGILRENPSHWVTGVIDDVKIWDVALTAAEVAAEAGVGAQINSVKQLVDSDGDGTADVHELIAGTDANDPSDYFHISGITPAEDGLMIEFDGVEGHAYEIEFSTDLSEGSWNVVGSQNADETAPMEFMHADRPAGQGFYRARIVQD